MNYLAKNIRFLRRNSSKRQEDIGFLVNKGQTTIGNWENGKSEPNIGELLIISNYFDISIDALLKVDLATTPVVSGEPQKGKILPATTENRVKYNQNEWESLVNEQDERILTQILQEVRALRQEFNQSRGESNAINRPAKKDSRKKNSNTESALGHRRRKAE